MRADERMPASALIAPMSAPAAASPSAADLPAASPGPDVTAGTGERALLQISIAVFIAFLPMGMAMPSLPVHVHHGLGASTVAVGVVMAAQFLAAVVSRGIAGGTSDVRGPPVAVRWGLVAGVVAGLLYAASLTVTDRPSVAVGILCMARLGVGAAESFIVTGTLAWGARLLGPERTGKVMAWIGIAMYAAYAAGAPLGAVVADRYGFVAIAVAAVVFPLLAALAMRRAPPVGAAAARRLPFGPVLRTVALPGLGLSLSSIGFGVITAFVALTFVAAHWSGAGLAFTAFGIAFVGARLLFGDLPDRIGGARVALVSVLIEAAGLGLLWIAPAPGVAYLGAALTGFGYSLAFPGFGVEAVRRVPPAARGAAMGAYVMFLDIALALTGPVAGAIGGRWGLRSVFGIAMVVVAAGAVVAIVLLRERRTPADGPAAH